LQRTHQMKFIFLFYLFLFHFGIGFSQSSLSLISTANHTLKNTLLSVEISIGEPITELFTGSQHVITHGFLQPDPIVKVNSIKTISDSDIKIFPNPFDKTLMIESGFSQLTGILNDYTGRTVIEADVHTLWDVSQISSGVYTLLLMDKDGHLIYTSKLCKIEF